MSGWFGRGRQNRRGESIEEEERFARPTHENGKSRSGRERKEATTIFLLLMDGGERERIDRWRTNPDVRRDDLPPRRYCIGALLT